MKKPRPTLKPEPQPAQPVIQPRFEWLLGAYEPVRYQRQQDFLRAALDYHAANRQSAEVKAPVEEPAHAAD